MSGNPLSNMTQALQIGEGCHGIHLVIRSMSSEFQAEAQISQASGGASNMNQTKTWGLNVSKVV